MAGRIKLIYIVPASGPEAADHFEKTIRTKRKISEASKFLDKKHTENLSKIFHGQDYTVWGSLPGSGNISNWQKLQEGDYILFYQSGKYTFIAEVAYKARSRRLAEYFWGTSRSGETWEYIYFLINDRFVSIPSEELNKYLGYKSNYTPQGFSGIDPKKLQKAIRRYGDVYDLIMSLDKGVEIKEVPPEKEELLAEVGEEAVKEPTIHDEIQWRLIRLGSLSNDIWVAKNDRKKIYKGNSFAKFSLPKLPNIGFDPISVRTVEMIDTVWIKGHRIDSAFEIEHSTAIYSGLLRLSDLKILQPNVSFPLYVVAKNERKPNVFKQLKRPTFSHEQIGLDKAVKFLSYERIRDLYGRYASKGYPLPPSILEKLAEPCPT